MNTIEDTLQQYLETFPYTKWKQVMGYQARLKDTHFFCGFIPRENYIDVLIRTTKSQQLKAKKHLTQAKSFTQEKDWTEVVVADLRDLQMLQPYIDQAYKQVLTLKREKDERTLKY